jgi:primosomal protein N'
MPSGLSEFAEVAVPVAVHGTFTYAIPPELRDAVRLGSRVEVPFGAKRNTGFVVGLSDAAPEGSKIKPIRAVLDDDEPALLPEIIELCRWAAEYYIAPLGEMLRVALPANMSARGRRELALVGDESMIAAAITSEQILDADLPLIDELRRRPLPFATALEASSRSSIERLRDAGLITIGDRVTDAKGVRYDRFVILETVPAGLTAKQQQAVDLLSSRGVEMSVRAMENAGAGEEEHRSHRTPRAAAYARCVPGGSRSGQRR